MGRWAAAARRGQALDRSQPSAPVLGTDWSVTVDGYNQQFVVTLLRPHPRGLLLFVRFRDEPGEYEADFWTDPPLRFGANPQATADFSAFAEGEVAMQACWVWDENHDTFASDWSPETVVNKLG